MYALMLHLLFYVVACSPFSLHSQFCYVNMNKLNGKFNGKQILRYIEYDATALPPITMHKVCMSQLI